MNTTKAVFAPTVIAASLMAAFGTAWSAENAEVDALIKPSSEVSIGVGGWSKDRQNLGAYDGMRKRDSYLLLDADVKRRDDATGTWLNLNISNFGTRNREIRGEYLQQGNQGVIFDYTEFRADAPYTINTKATGIGTTMQNPAATNILNTAIGTGTNYQLGTDRKKAGLSFYKSLLPELDLNVKFSSEDKTGTRLTTNGSALFAADLIDRTTSKAEITLNYHHEALQLAGGYYGSWFKNNNSAGYVAAGATLATANVMTQPLDNQSHQLFVDGSYRFTPTTKGNFKVAFTRGTQNEAIPTSSITGATVYGNLPSLNGKVDTTLAQFGLTAKPMPKLNLVANLRYHDRDDKTPQYGSVPRVDNPALAIALSTTPWSYKTLSGKLEGTYVLPEGYSATAGLDYSAQDRTVWTSIAGVAYNSFVPLRDKVKEATYRLQVRKSLSDTLNGSVAFLQGDRTGSDFTTSTNLGTATVSPVNSADRERQKLRLVMDWTPMEKLGVQFMAETAKDNYGNGERWQGLQKGKADLYSLDATYQLSDAWQLAGWYSHNTNDAEFDNRRLTIGNISRHRSQNDTGEAFGLKLTGAVDSKTKVGAELSWFKDKTAFVQSQSDGAALVDNALAVVAPDITSKVLKLNFFANYSLDKSTELRFDVAYQRWQSNDWQWTYQSGLPWQFGTATDGTTVITTPKQDATFIGARYVYKFQ